MLVVMVLCVCVCGGGELVRDKRRRETKGSAEPEPKKRKDVLRVLRVTAASRAQEAKEKAEKAKRRAHKAERKREVDAAKAIADARERRSQGPLVALPGALGMHAHDMLTSVDQAAVRRVSKAYAAATRTWPRRVCVAASAIDPAGDTDFTDGFRTFRRDREGDENYIPPDDTDLLQLE
jgi:hypothetical protein